MSTHNIGFYEEISEIISYHQIRTLSLFLTRKSVCKVRKTHINLFSYNNLNFVYRNLRCYFICAAKTDALADLLRLSLVARKPVFWVSDQV